MPFPSSPGPLYQNEVKCSAFDMETIFILKQMKLIFTRKVAHLASFWKWGFLELGSGLLIWKEFSYTKRANAKKVVHKRPLVVKFARLTLTCIRAIVWFGFHCKFPRSFCPFWVYAWDWVGVVSNCTMVLFSGHGFWPIFSRYIVMANKTSGCFTKQSSRHTTTEHKTMQPRALSIQPKIPDISVGTSNGTDHFGLARPKFSGPALKVVHSDRSGHFSRSNRNVPFRLTKLLSPGSTALLYPAFKNNNQTRGGLGRVCATEMYHSIEHVKFPKFRTAVSVEWKANKPTNISKFQFD